MKALPKCVETLQRDRAMPKDTGEFILKKSINLYCQPIFSYISSFVIAPYAPFSQSLSHILLLCIVRANFVLITRKEGERNFEIAARTLCLRVCGATPRFTAVVKISSRIVEKRSLRNQKLKTKQSFIKTEEQRKERLRIRREKERKTKRISARLFSKDCSGVMKMSWREN